MLGNCCSNTFSIKNIYVLIRSNYCAATLIKYLSKKIFFVLLLLSFAFGAGVCFASLEKTFETWKRLYKNENGNKDFLEIMNFIEKNPDWPAVNILQKRAEMFLAASHYHESGTEQKVVRFFNKFPPITGEGAFYYARALARAGKLEQAKAIAKKAWASMDFTDETLVEFRNAFKSFLTSADDENRALTMMYNENIAAAQKVIPFLKPKAKKNIQTRIDIFNGNGTDEAVAFDKNNEEVFFEHLRHARRTKNYQKGMDMLKNPQNVVSEEKYPEQWWKERNFFAREMMEAKKYQEAFNIIKWHKLKSGENYVNANWLMGWISLRFLGQAKPAYNAFKNTYAQVKSPQSLSRFAFWTAEAAYKIGLRQEAEGWYNKAAAIEGTYYGFLASSRLKSIYKKSIKQLQLNKYKVHASQASNPKSSLLKNNVFKVMKIMTEEDKNKFLLLFVQAVLDSAKTDQERVFLIKACNQIGGARISARVALGLRKYKYYLLEEAYPTLNNKQKNGVIARVANNRPWFHSFVHAVIRQESVFDAFAESYAGAKGLMQLMPDTANRQIERLKKYGLKVSGSEGLFNSDKNVTLGAVHLDELLSEFNGSIVLAVAAYNAGSHNVKKWIQVFGDPRDNKNWVDFVEAIPFGETRNYVQRVLENFIVYEFKSVNKSQITTERNITTDMGMLIGKNLRTRSL